MNAPTVGVLAVQGDVREHLAMLRECGAQAITVRRPTELARVDGIVLPGGESTTIDKLLRAFDLFEPLRARIRAGMPVYGTCAGMILLADRVLDAIAGQQSLGGIDMTVRRNAFGRQVDSFETDIEIDGRALGIRQPSVPDEASDGHVLRRHVAFIRAPLVESVASEVRIVSTLRPARTDHRAEAAAAPAAPNRDSQQQLQIVAVRQGNALATAFHPEITGCLDFHRQLVALAAAV